MPHDDDQSGIVSESTESIRDRTVVHDFTDAEVVLARERRASDEPRYSTQQVLEHIQSLEQ